MLHVCGSFYYVQSNNMVSTLITVSYVVGSVLFTSRLTTAGPFSKMLEQ